MDPVEEEQMIAWCRQGNLAGYRLVYERYSGPLLRMAMRTLGRFQDAEDAVQETFLRLFRGIHGFRSGSRFSTYLFQILHNTCIDLLRKRKPAAGGLADSPAVEGLSVPASQEFSHEFAQAVGRLPEQMRASFLLFAVEEFSEEETAEILATSVGAVKTQVQSPRGATDRRLRSASRSAGPRGSRVIDRAAARRGECPASRSSATDRPARRPFSSPAIQHRCTCVRS